MVVTLSGGSVSVRVEPEGGMLPAATGLTGFRRDRRDHGHPGPKVPAPTTCPIMKVIAKTNRSNPTIANSIRNTISDPLSSHSLRSLYDNGGLSS